MTLALSGTNGLLQSYDYQVPVTGFTYTFTPSTTGTVLVMNPAGTLATGTITMPALPADGMTVTFSSTKIITALTVSANTGQTINNAVTTLAAGQSASYVYRAASTAWFPFSDVSVAATVTTYGGPRAQLFTTQATGQTFTIPAGITNIKVTIQGSGGGGGGSATCSGVAGGTGGPGGLGVQWFTGLTSGNTLTVNISAGGGGGSTGNSGGTGGSVSVASGTQTISTITATGGGGGGAGGGGGSNGGTSGFVSPGYAYPNALNILARGQGGTGQGGGGGNTGGTGAVLFEY